MREEIVRNPERAERRTILTTISFHRSVAGERRARRPVGRPPESQKRKRDPGRRPPQGGGADGAAMPSAEEVAAQRTRERLAQLRLTRLRGRSPRPASPAAPAEEPGGAPSPALRRARALRALPAAARAELDARAERDDTVRAGARLAALAAAGAGLRVRRALHALLDTCADAHQVERTAGALDAAALRAGGPCAALRLWVLAELADAARSGARGRADALALRLLRAACLALPAPPAPPAPGPHPASDAPHLRAPREEGLPRPTEGHRAIERRAQDAETEPAWERVARQAERSGGAGGAAPELVRVAGRVLALRPPLRSRLLAALCAERAAGAEDAPRALRVRMMASATRLRLLFEAPPLRPAACDTPPRHTEHTPAS